MASTVLAISLGIICCVLFEQTFANDDLNKDNNELRCYFCEYQMTNACGDITDITALTSVACNSLNYTPPIKGGDRRAVTHDVLSRVVDGKFRGAPLLRDIFQKDAAARVEQPFKYVCLRISLTAEDKKGTIRSCIRQENTIEDACDFIKQEIDPSLKVNYCHSCDGDNCNLGSSLSFSNLALSLGICISYFKIIHAT